MTSYYNEIDKSCCKLLREQIQDGNLPDGFVDERSIVEVQPNDIKQYNEAHFFAGIGGLSLGFARAAIPANSNVWTGGFPCQDLSIAGKRAGLAGERSGLYFEFHRLITENYPEWVVLENVPGLLSSNEGRDFAIVIGGLTGIIPDVPTEGWGNAGLFRGSIYNVAYRILDAQFFGVPQRRRRVFIVGSLGNGRAAKVLFESEGLHRDIAESREEGQVIASTLRAGADAPKHDADYRGRLVALPIARGNRQDLDNETYIVNLANSGANQNNVKETDVMDTLDTWSSFAVARSLTASNQRNDFETENLLAYKIRGGGGQGGKGFLGSEKTAFSLSTSQDQYLGVRRLTPVECERLQGFPDNWTAGFADTVRYRMLGNAVAVPCAEWIGRRIMEQA